MSNGYNGNSDALEPSDLSKIDNPPDSPFDLFKEWFEGAKSSNLVLPHALILSTATSFKSSIDEVDYVWTQLDRAGSQAFSTTHVKIV
ncbi:hypothetical protein M8J77_010159 [Diaphorina citri]|nr:hypothetical protein M8J77_010159 [Diaphorina citri]